jgi:hypothetical protein
MGAQTPRIQRRRTVPDDAARPTDRVALTSALVGALLIATLVASRCGFSGPDVTTLPQALSDPGQPPHVQVGHQDRETISEVSVTARAAAAQSAGAAEAAPAAQPTQQPQPTAAAAGGERMRISGTDGRGVLPRNSPHDADLTTRGFIEGWEVTVLERSGDWARVRGPNGQEGWIPTRYLSP